MQINWNLFPLMNKLASKNQTMANDLAARIDKREIRIIANLAIWTTNTKPKSKK